MKKIMNLKFVVFLLLLAGGYIYSKAQQPDTLIVLDTSICIAYDTTVYLNAQRMARFQEGDLQSFVNYVRANIVYPLIDGEMKQGKVLVKFIVNWEGYVQNVQVFKSSGVYGLDAEAVRVVRSSPQWKPAKNNNLCVSSQYIIPVEFRYLGTFHR